MRRLLALLLLLTSLPVTAAELQQSFDLRVASPPSPVAIEGRQHLVYELQLTNFAPSTLELTRLDVLDADAPGTPLATWQGDALTARIGLPGAGKAATTRAIAQGMHVVLYVELALPPHAHLPRALRHRLAFEAIHPAGREAGIVQGGETVLDTRTPAVFDPPLRGGPWIAIYSAAMPRGHRRVTFALDGQVHIPARFAIDWMKLDADGHLAHGDEDKPSHWYGYGQDVLAVADGTVAAVRNDYPESPTLANPRHPLDGASGNYVSLDLGDGRYVHYEHLRPGSVRVHAGDRLHRGQVIAALGFTGDSTGPHLHMHVSNGPVPLAGEGLPFVLADFSLLGGYPSIEAFGRGEHWAGLPAGVARARQMEMPAEDAVVEFP